MFAYVCFCSERVDDDAASAVDPESENFVIETVVGDNVTSDSTSSNAVAVHVRVCVAVSYCHHFVFGSVYLPV